MAKFITHEFYGSTIKGVIPQGWIDASTLREVPDHQEIFLSATTLSNQIIEINQRVDRDEALSATRTQPLSTDSLPETIDKAAIMYHLHDLCDESDTLEVLVPAQKVPMQEIPKASAYRGVVALTATKMGQHRREQREGQTQGQAALTTNCHYLLVRLEEQETDLLVFVNVPSEEFDARGDVRGLEEENKLAEGLIGELVVRLKVVDWGLFA
ncbi:hypothetical protein EYZ11_005387 [Aspergillus tanneri]|uniref:Uncharacterized protein n=1 Tax=Aspergillus tanneri TaxID=1220188 RepID=A0A4V6RQU6_9EURO|nr:uncharacterized protein ATNIH1004_002473 [Aspergillus tanneri]KAA8649797.1 hypothetical protein ATNIH1004_002473 [Aspergillus tanneri]THC95144.1 hypothetical protein EYZ11_005387 [Aspergillus tanneri]